MMERLREPTIDLLVLPPIQHSTSRLALYQMSSWLNLNVKGLTKTASGLSPVRDAHAHLPLAGRPPLLLRIPSLPPSPIQTPTPTPSLTLTLIQI